MNKKPLTFKQEILFGFIGDIFIYVIVGLLNVVQAFGASHIEEFSNILFIAYEILAVILFYGSFVIFPILGGVKYSIKSGFMVLFWQAVIAGLGFLFMIQFG